MSTRSTTHFKQGDETVAIVYRHTEGYPEGAGRDIMTFLNECATLQHGSRFGDPSYLAAKYVVFLAGIFHQVYLQHGASDSPLDFLSVGICMEDPGDIEFRYEIHCSRNKRPDVKCFHRTDWSNPVEQWEEAPIP